MKIKTISTAGCILLMFLFAVDTYGKKDPGVKYTRIGAEYAGNKTGEITAFEGDKDLKCPSGYVTGKLLPNPYGKEKPLFRINYKNVDKYKERLSPGQVARIKKNKKFYMDVYPTHRNMVFPEYFYTALEKNLKTCRLDKRNQLAGYHGGIPFAYPDNAIQAIWNVKKNSIGDDVKVVGEARRVVSPSGRIKKEIWTTKVLIYDTRIHNNLPNPNGISMKIIARYTYPADMAGTALLTVRYIDDERPDDAWLYLPTLRRVRRAPSMTKGAQIDGESTMDENTVGFGGQVNDWNWKLIGKKEIYVPSNCYDMWKIGAKDEDECWAGDINPQGARWELRRVWVIEGRLKPGVNHPYSRRVEYVDEDSWGHVVGDRYDRRGNLWRHCVFYTYYDYCEKYRTIIAQLFMNLESGRYELKGGSLTKDSRLFIPNTGLDPEDFTVTNLRQAGR